MSLFAPSIKGLIPIDKIPPALNFAEKAISDLLDEIFYEDLVVYTSQYGEYGYYDLTLVLYTKLGLTFPGGFALSLNPDIENNLRTLIPISFNYKWEALRYVNKLDLENFSPTPKGFFDVLKKIAAPKLEELLAITLEVFLPGGNAIQTFINQINNEYSKGINVSSVLSNNASQIVYIVNEISRNGLDLFEVIFDNYINIGTEADIIDNIKCE